MSGDEEDTANMDVNRAYESFEQDINLINNGDFELVINDIPKVSSRGGMRIDFRITLEEALSNGVRDIAVSGINGPGFSFDEMLKKATEMAEQKFEQLQAKKEADDMRKLVTDLQTELKEAKGKVDDPINKFIGALAPHAEPIIAGLMGSPTKPFVGTAIGNATPSRQNYVTALQANRPNDWLEILGKLTNVINENPDKFEMALKFL